MENSPSDPHYWSMIVQTVLYCFAFFCAVGIPLYLLFKWIFMARRVAAATGLSYADVCNLGRYYETDFLYTNATTPAAALRMAERCSWVDDFKKEYLLLHSRETLRASDFFQLRTKEEARTLCLEFQRRRCMTPMEKIIDKLTLMPKD
jgi:hypothetical protein